MKILAWNNLTSLIGLLLLAFGGVCLATSGKIAVSASIRSVAKHNTNAQVRTACQNLNESRCEWVEPGPPQAFFDDGQWVHMVLDIDKLPPGKRISVAWHLYGPGGRLRHVRDLPVDVPRGWNQRQILRLYDQYLPTMVGKWRMQLRLDRRVLAESSFTVRDRASQ
jgi:hypothetical protein